MAPRSAPPEKPHEAVGVRPHLVVDGSNVATEGRDAPSLAQLDEAVQAYMREYRPQIVTVVVDATFPNRIARSERTVYEAAVSAGEIITPPAGAVGRGDAFILQIADRAEATILSNDSFQEFHGLYEWLFDPGRLIGGKPVPHVGWVFIDRTPVRGPLSRRAVSAAKKAGLATAAAEAAAAGSGPTAVRPTKTGAAKRSAKKAAEPAAGAATKPGRAAKGSASAQTEATASAPKSRRSGKGSAQTEPALSGDAATAAGRGGTPAGKSRRSGKGSAQTEAAATAAASQAGKDSGQVEGALSGDAAAAAGQGGRAGSKSRRSRKGAAQTEAALSGDAVPAPGQGGRAPAQAEGTSSGDTAAAAGQGGRAGSRSRRSGKGAAQAEGTSPGDAATAVDRGGRAPAQAEGALSGDAAASPEGQASGSGGKGRAGKAPKQGDAKAAEAVVPPAPTTGAGTPANEALPFIEFVGAHPVGSEVQAQVEQFSSHGAYARIGQVQAYVPLKYLAEPAPRSAKQVLRLGETRVFVVVAIDPARRGIDLALPGLAPPDIVPPPSPPAPAEKRAAGRAKKASARK